MTALLPPVAPRIVAEAVDMLPSRLRKRLDGIAAEARGWTVVQTTTGVTITIDDQTSVTLNNPVQATTDAVCSCLLAPRCLHRAAILTIAPVLDAVPPIRPEPGPEQSQPDVAITPVQAAAAEALSRAAMPLLEHGIAGAGATIQAGILRAVHEARQVGLPRAASAAVRVVEQLRTARADEARFRLAALTDDLRELLTVCHLLTGAVGDLRAAIGVARRDYEPVGDLRLSGICTEPIVTSSGYTGIATHLSDCDSRIWTISDVRPSQSTIARPSAETMVSIGDVRLTHRELSRAGLAVAGAHGSADGRLSVGREVQAVSTRGMDWSGCSLWTTPLAEQAKRYHDALALPLSMRPGGYDLAFVDGVIGGAVSDGLLITLPGSGLAITVGSPIDDPSLPYVTNLRLLATAVGHPIRLVGRFASARQLAGIAVTGPWLPEHYGGHVDLGIDRMRRSDLPTASAPPRHPEPQPQAGPHAVQVLRHRLERAVAGGRRTAQTTDTTTLGVMPTAETLLAQLCQAASSRHRDAFGRLTDSDTHLLANAWLAAATYEQVVSRALLAAAWTATGPAASHSNYLPPTTAGV